MYPFDTRLSRRTTDEKTLGDLAPNDPGGRRLYATRRRALNAQLRPSRVLGFRKRWSAGKVSARMDAPSALAADVQPRDL